MNTSGIPPIKLWTKGLEETKIQIAKIRRSTDPLQESSTKCSGHF